MENFYENIAHAYFGGERKTRQSLENIEFDECEPDIEHFKKERWIEVKASKKNNYFKLFDHQLEKYKELLNGEFPFAKPKVDYVLFSYDIKDVFKECPEEEILIENLAKRTKSMTIIPLSIIEEMHKRCKTGKCKLYRPFVCFRHGDYNLFWTNIDDAFKKFGLNMGDYIITKRRFPGNYSIEGFKINSFPILDIKHAKYEGWLFGFKEKNV